jgi:hypothetical protein
LSAASWSRTYLIISSLRTSRSKPYLDCCIMPQQTVVVVVCVCVCVCALRSFAIDCFSHVPRQSSAHFVLARRVYSTKLPCLSHVVLVHNCIYICTLPLVSARLTNSAGNWYPCCNLPPTTSSAFSRLLRTTSSRYSTCSPPKMVVCPLLINYPKFHTNFLSPQGPGLQSEPSVWRARGTSGRRGTGLSVLGALAACSARSLRVIYVLSASQNVFRVL